MAKPRSLPNEAAEAPVAPEKPHYLGHRERLLASSSDALAGYEGRAFTHAAARSAIGKPLR